MRLWMLGDTRMHLICLKNEQNKNGENRTMVYSPGGATVFCKSLHFVGLLLVSRLWNFGVGVDSIDRLVKLHGKTRQNYEVALHDI